VVQEHINRTSDFAVGSWWRFCLKFVTPLVLGYMSIANLIGDIRSPYEGYSSDALFYFGWFLVVMVVVIGFILQTTTLMRKGVSSPVESTR
jgi:NSS family neurotransmitter:Na+ symporter